MRPIGVSILAILIILFGVLVLLIGIIGLLGTTLLIFTPLKDLAPVALVVSLLFFIVGLILIISGLGLWRLRMWAWVLAVIVLVLLLLGQLLSFGQSGQFSLVSSVIDLVLLIYLLLIREQFY